jgi:inosine/xanthosine triphosphate pyrophosphatase family protein
MITQVKNILFATGNSSKLLNARAVCSKYGIKVVQKIFEVDEIQSENAEKVALDKANKSFSLAKRPIVITDDSWSMLGLNGFPGVYMHSLNTWFKPEDFLRLTLPLADRRIILTQILVYTDSQQQKVFTMRTEGKLIKEVRGSSEHASHTITTMPGDNGLTIAEAYNKGVDRSQRQSAQIWHEFARWYAE